MTLTVPVIADVKPSMIISVTILVQSAPMSEYMKKIMDASQNNPITPPATAPLANVVMPAHLVKI